MKLMIGDYEVEIKAKSKWSKRNNKCDVVGFLNELSIVLYEASKVNASEGYRSLSERYYNMSDDIYKVLNKMGVYNVE